MNVKFLCKLPGSFERDLEDIGDARLWLVVSGSRQFLVTTVRKGDTTLRSGGRHSTEQWVVVWESLEWQGLSFKCDGWDADPDMSAELDSAQDAAIEEHEKAL